MGVILNPDFETATDWIFARVGTGFDLPAYSSDWSPSGSKCMKFRLACNETQPNDRAYMYQSITVQNNHKLSFQLKAHDRHFSSFVGIYFRVLFNDTVVYSLTDPDADTGGYIYRCHAGSGYVWRNNCWWIDQIVDVDLSAYAGQTGDIVFEFWYSEDEFPLDHLYENILYLDDITETYDTVYEYYVKTTGSDSKSGLSWNNAWKTVNKAATTVPDGSTVHIGFGDYTAEPAGNKIAPQNIGANGIKYLCETAGSSGGVGTVKIEKN